MELQIGACESKQAHVSGVKGTKEILAMHC